MPARISFKASVRKDLKHCDRATVDRILDAIDTALEGSYWKLCLVMYSMAADARKPERVSPSE